MASQITVAAAFGAGVLSFLSPCVLPLVPGYLSFVSGVNFAAARADGGAQVAHNRTTVMVNSLAFVLGFSTVFIVLGASATFIGAFLLAYQQILAKAAGVLLILFGIHMTGLVPIKALYQEKRFHVVNKPLGLIGAYVVGCAFAFGWTPCIGPILAGILTVAGSQDSVGQGILLLAAYSAGLGVPFLLAALGISQFFTFFDKFKHHLRKVEIASGLLLVAVGVLIFSDKLSAMAGWFPFLNEFAK